jgi:hypothetical protein
MNKIIGKLSFVVSVVVLTAGCSSDDSGGGGTSLVTDPAAITFSTEVNNGGSRVTTGLINNVAQLQNMTEGFGVFAYNTETTAFNTTDFKNKDHATTRTFANFFMQNQQVTWSNAWMEKDAEGNPILDGKGLEQWHKDWVYSPLKYWPNYTKNEDSSDGGETPGPRYISFFAYAPWADATTTPDNGVINYTRSDDRTPHVIYKIGAADQQVDLLWANAIDAKRNNQGLITVSTSGDPAVTTLEYQKVPLQFKHALSAIDIYVQRVYDEPAYTGKIPAAVLYPTLYISKLEIASTTTAADSKNGLQTSGKLSLIDGTWEDPGAPNAWVDDSKVKITYNESMINDTINGTSSTSEEYIRDAELDKWKWILDTKNTVSTDDDEWVDATTITTAEYEANPGRWKSAYGVSEDERNLLKNSMTQVLIPRKVTLIPTLTYSMVTRDDDLRINYLTDTEGHKYNRIVNEVEANSVTLDLVAGKRYTLLIRIGVEHVSFELVNIVDWDFPMRFTPNVVTEFENEEQGKIVNEE